MLTSDLNSEPETGHKKPKKHRPSVNGPSSSKQHANRHTGISKTFQTKTPVHLYPIRGYKKPSDAPNYVSSNTLPVETDQNTQPPSPQVETDEAPVHVETSPPSKGMLVTCSYELKKYK